MRTADDHDTVGGVPREMECPACGHCVHGYLIRCGAPLADDVRCPCRCPIPGTPIPSPR